MTWTEAFKAQATSDLDIYEHLSRTALPACHRLHYLQMASEKAAKARLARGSADPPGFSHRGAGDLVRLVLRNDDSLGRALGYSSRGQRLEAAKSLRDTAVAIELLAPAIANAEQTGRNAEYPWQSPTGEILAPAGIDFSDVALHSIKLALFARFLRAFLDRL